jgi:hypothetical protein
MRHLLRTIEHTGPRRSGAGTRWLLLIAVALLVAPGVSACSGATAPVANPAAAPTHAAMPTMAPAAPAGDTAAAREAAWAARPAYVSADARTQTAYRIALDSPQLLQWMPCYCGCGAMGHRSNLDCYFKPTMDGLTGIQFEEHASYCGICVDTTLMAKQLLDHGQSLRAIRDAIDRTFGGTAPGTPTKLPPA